MSKEIQIRDGNLIASFDLENEDGDIDFCKLLKVSHGIAEEIGMFVDYVATNKIIGDQSKQIAELKTENEILKGQVEELNDDNMSLRKKTSKEGVEILLDIKQQLKDNTKQVCEKIREKCQVWATGPTGKIGYLVRDTELDLLEKGE